jgi:RNA-directed DNA polymerase
MKRMRQKDQRQMPLDLATGKEGEAREAGGRDELSIAKQQTESPTGSEKLMEAICERSNLIQAWKRVKENKGSAGIDGMSVDELKDYLDKDWSRIRQELLTARYKPQPVRRVEIPKPDGSKRKLGIPTVVDRFIQQAVLQVLQKEWDGSFSDYSYGFRPGRSAHEAVKRAQEYVKEGNETVVDIDLEKFFDRVNHDVLMSRVARRVKDKRVLKLIRSFLTAGMMEGGLVSPTDEGRPQGGPLSPLLSNLLLDELDKELEKRGHRFVRYADDCNIYVSSQKAGERVMASVTKFLEKKLKLKVNRAKSAVGKPSERKFLGFRISVDGRRGISPQALKRFKDRIRETTNRSSNAGWKDLIAELRGYLRGWREYYGICETPRLLKDLDSWIRHRLRCLIWQRWKTFQNRYRKLKHFGISEVWARKTAASRKGAWRISHSRALDVAFPTRYFKEAGLPSLAD